MGSISDSLSLDDIITRDEGRELLRTRDRVAAEVFEVVILQGHLVIRTQSHIHFGSQEGCANNASIYFL